METLFLNTNFEIQSPLQEPNSEVVTFLIPKSYLDRLNPEDQKKLPKRLPLLLKKYAKYIASTKRLNKKAGKTLYQIKTGKNNMKRINARTRTGSWALLGALAQAHGVSRCYLFNYLLWLDDLGVGDSIVDTLNAGVPTFHENYRYTLLLDLLNNKIIRKLEFEPNPFKHIFTYRDWLHT
ncbi:DUF1564 domain-containing protein [Leptospira sp. WS92.C1]